MKLRRTAFAVALLLLLAPAAAPANKSDFSFTMEHMVVNGKKNKIIHTLAPGPLTISGSLWITHVAPGAVGPNDIKIVVKKLEDGFFVPDPDVCTIAVTPSTVEGRRVTFHGSCGSVSGSLYLLAFRNDDDGRDIQGSGTLLTENRP